MLLFVPFSVALSLLPSISIKRNNFIVPYNPVMSTVLAYYIVQAITLCSLSQILQQQSKHCQLLPQYTAQTITLSIYTIYLYYLLTQQTTTIQQTIYALQAFPLEDCRAFQYIHLSIHTMRRTKCSALQLTTYTIYLHCKSSILYRCMPSIIRVWAITKYKHTSAFYLSTL